MDTPFHILTLSRCERRAHVLGLSNYDLKMIISVSPMDCQTELIKMVLSSNSESWLLSESKAEQIRIQDA